MEEWERQYVDEEGPAHITFEEHGQGEVRFLLIHGNLDWNHDVDFDRVEFGFSGFEELDEVCGRGWAKIEGEQMVGQITIHPGDISGFKARKSG